MRNQFKIRKGVVLIISIVLFIFIVRTIKPITYYFTYNNRLNKINENLECSVAIDPHIRSNKILTVEFKFDYNDQRQVIRNALPLLFSIYQSNDYVNKKWLVVFDKNDPSCALLVNSFSIDSVESISVFRDKKFEWSFTEGVVLVE